MQERHWVALVSPERFADERLYAHESITLPTAPGVAPGPGQPVVLVVAADPPELFALGRVVAFGEAGATSSPGAPSPEVTIQYTHRLFDEPIRVDDLAGEGGEPGEPGEHRVSPLTAEAYDRLADRVGAERRVDADKAGWLVSLALPIEAATPAEAVREFWTYVAKLGPRELPAFVWPTGDELAMQAYVLGDPTNLDPEEDG